MSERKPNLSIVAECQKMMEDGESIESIYFHLAVAMVAIYEFALEDEPVNHPQMASDLMKVLYETIQIHEGKQSDKNNIHSH